MITEQQAQAIRAAIASSTAAEERYMVTAMNPHGETATMHTDKAAEARDAIRAAMYYGYAVYYERESRVNKESDWHGVAQTWNARRGWGDKMEW